VLPHLTQTDAKERLVLEAVVDTHAERALETAKKYGVPHHFSSVDTMLDEADVDVVLVITPIPFHFPIALQAIQAGKHVYVQKSMTQTVKEADVLLAARDKAGVMLAAAPGFEVCSTTRAMREVVGQGAIGKVCVAYTYTLGFGHEREAQRTGEGALETVDPTWYYRAGGGPLPDVTVYALQLLTSLLGSVVRVTALGNKTSATKEWGGKSIPVEIDDNAVATLEFASGALAVAAGTNSRGGSRNPWGGLALYGTGGALEVTDVHGASGYPLAFEVTGQNAELFSTTLGEQPYIDGAHLDLQEPHVYADIMDLSDAVREGRPPRASGEQARHVVDIIEKVLESTRTGHVQELTTRFTPG